MPLRLELSRFLMIYFIEWLSVIERKNLTIYRNFMKKLTLSEFLAQSGIMLLAIPCKLVRFAHPPAEHNGMMEIVECWVKERSRKAHILY